RSHGITLIAACVLGLGISMVPAEMENKVGAAMWEGKQGVMTAVFSVFEPGGDKGRLAMWQRTLEMISDWPIMGIGAGNWKFIYPLYSQGDMINVRVAPHRPHNDFLWIWSELGTVGLVAYLFLLWTVFRTGFRRLKALDGPMLTGALLACLTGILVNSLFSFPREFPGTWLPFYLALAGLGLGASSRQYNMGLGLWALVAVLALGLGITFKQIRFDFHALPMRIAFARSAWKETLRQADAALSWGPFDEEAFLMRGQAYAGLGNLRQARRDYEQGLVYHPNSIGLWNGMGQVRQQLGDRTGAAQAFYRALDLDPKLGEIYNNIGTLHAQSGALDSAAVAYQRAIEFEASLVDAYANLSIVYRKQDDLVRALDTARLGLKLGPDNLEMLNASGNALMNARRFGAAAKMFIRALQVDSTRVEIYYNLGRTYELRGDSARAIRAYQTFLDRWSGGEVLFIDAARQRLRVLAHPE
ncbi:MAG: tetratricopeptide repeat protein, partial [bacterium]|nr:tetratricopeptide repeat protein [bacterium]